MNEMKELLLEILEKAIQQPDINATQQMGVQLSTAVKREGVVIIQNQNVEVLTHIVPTIIKALRLCDEPANIRGEILEITNEPLEEACRYFFNKETKWVDMQKIMCLAYRQYVLARFNTKVRAAEFLGIQSTYLHKLTREKEKEE